MGIESSCDETALAVVDQDLNIKSSLVSSQVAKHAPFGGVIPEIASREHLSNLSILKSQLKENFGKDIFNQISAVCVTQGPGLVGCLLVGGAFARGIALRINCPLIPVDHIHAHLCGAWLEQIAKKDLSKYFPALGLVVSGGHTNLYFMNSPLEHRLLAYSVDDACGEALDKVARLLGLPYPGGAELEILARGGDANSILFPKVRIEGNELRFSFSGLKTFARNTLQNNKDLSRENFAASFQKTCFEQIWERVDKATEFFPQAKTVFVSGGVAANQYFNKLFKENLDKKKMHCFFSKKNYSGDNAAMIAAQGILQFENSKKQDVDFSNLNSWDVYARYPFEKFI